MNNRPPLQPRIAFLLSSLKFGGGERVALNLAAALQDQGYAIDFVLMQDIGELLGEARARFNVIDLRCKRTWMLPWLLGRYLFTARPVALISSFWKLNICACLARLGAPATRLALWEHSPPSRSHNSPTWAYAITATLLYRLATRVVAVSEGVAADVRRITWGLTSRIVTIHNPVPGPEADLSTRTPRMARTGRRILWIGRLAHPKNPALVVEAMAHLPRSLGARLFLLGDGIEREALEALVRARGLRGRVRLFGFQKAPYRFMAQADLLVLSSDREGLPTVLIEGLHAGLSLVSTDCAPGVHEILADGRLGTITPVGDAAALAAAMTDQLQHIPDRAAQRVGGQRFAPDLIANRFLQELGLPSPT